MNASSSLRGLGGDGLGPSNADYAGNNLNSMGNNGSGGSNNLRDAAAELQQAFAVAERNILMAISELEQRAAMQEPDTHECAAL
jgi:hypothetical protein